ncbi:MAG: MerR family transcriptional regulator [Actinomycetota bacterium]
MVTTSDSSAPSEPTLTPAEMVERTGVGLDTLRYYESEGLLTDVARAANGHRRYRRGDVLWVEVLRCLRETGMTIEQLRHYCRLGEDGPVTKPERKRILLDHRAEVERQIEERRRALDLIDHKLEHYADTRAIGVGTTPLTSQAEARS